MYQSQYFMNQSQDLTQFQMLNSQLVSEMNLLPQMMNPMASEAQMMMIPQRYTYWPVHMPQMNNLNFSKQINPNNGGANPGRSNWKGKKKAMDKKKKGVDEAEQPNQLKTKRVRNKKFDRIGPYAHAPRNTSTYLIRAKKEGGITSLVSPYPVTPAVLPTPVFSPSREALVDMAKEEWGVDGYGSMKGLIRLRSSGEGEGEDDGNSGEVCDVEERLGNDLSRFEMVCPNNFLGNRVDDQETQISQLEEDSLLLKEKLYLMEKDLGEMKRRMQCLESQSQVVQEIYEGMDGENA